MGSRQSLKLTSSVRFAASQPQPGRSAAGRCSLTADVDGSSPSPAAILQHVSKCFKRVSFKGQDRTLRTFRLPFESAYPCHPAFVQCGQDTALRTLKFRFESGRLDQFCAVVAERQRRLIVYQDQEGSTPFHRAMRPLASRPYQFSRGRARPDECPDFQSGDSRFNSGLPYRVRSSSG